jgi:hypothetical protein
VRLVDLNVVRMRARSVGAAATDTSFPGRSVVWNRRVHAVRSFP